MNTWLTKENGENGKIDIFLCTECTNLDSKISTNCDPHYFGYISCYPKGSMPVFNCIHPLYSIKMNEMKQIVEWMDEMAD